MRRLSDAQRQPGVRRNFTIRTAGFIIRGYASRLLKAGFTAQSELPGGAKMPEPQYMSQAKLDELTAELQELRTVRKPAIAQQINVARTRGGTDDNAEQDTVKRELSFVEGKIRALENLINNAVVGNPQPAAGGAGLADADDAVAIWRTVTVERDNGQQAQYQITGSLESDPAQGKISHLSPIGKSLLGKRPGDIAEVQTPRGNARIKVIAVR